MYTLLRYTGNPSHFWGANASFFRTPCLKYVVSWPTHDDDGDNLVNSQARARSLGFLGLHVEKSEWLTTDLIVSLMMIMETIAKMVMLVMRVTTMRY